MSQDYKTELEQIKTVLSEILMKVERLELIEKNLNRFADVMNDVYGYLKPPCASHAALFGKHYEPDIIWHHIRHILRREYFIRYGKESAEYKQAHTWTNEQIYDAIEPFLLANDNMDINRQFKDDEERQKKYKEWRKKIMPKWLENIQKEREEICEWGNPFI
ncbi:MAG: hypothetical protein Q8O30_12010 [Candidatus Omnitrophota bacterium]|nr:hypothetical protein [Candidatus Omnitrophota bacterium]